MKPAKPAKKPNSGAPGVKLLITAASLAATLGGWAVISAQETKPAPALAPAPQPAVASAVTIKLAPLPTLVPAATLQPRKAAVNQPRPAVVAPQPAPANVIVLRDVSAPALQDRSAPASGPAPVVKTRSSR